MMPSAWRQGILYSFADDELDETDAASLELFRSKIWKFSVGFMLVANQEGGKGKEKVVHTLCGYRIAEWYQFRRGARLEAVSVLNG